MGGVVGQGVSLLKLLGLWKPVDISPFAANWRMAE
jgi:hypothetical protein